MPFLKVLSIENLELSQNSQNSSLRTQNCKSKGFTLIELLVVIAIFGLTASLITASYLTFERNQRLKNAALLIQSEIRLLEDRAYSGDKGVDMGPDTYTFCQTTYRLGGWYLKLSVNQNTSFRVGGDCMAALPGWAETSFFPQLKSDGKGIYKSFNLPKDIKISGISCDSTPYSGEINVLFRPLSSEIRIYPVMTTLDFYDPTGILRDGNCSGNELIIKLLQGSGNYYQVKIKLSTGEVDVSKI